MVYAYIAISVFGIAAVWDIWRRYFQYARFHRDVYDRLHLHDEAIEKQEKRLDAIGERLTITMAQRSTSMPRIGARNQGS